MDNEARGFERIGLMITVAHRGVGDKIIEDLREMGITYNMAAVGERLGGLHLTGYLGLEDAECDILLSVVTESKAERAMALIEYGYSEPEDGDASAALVPIDGVSGPLALEYISGVAGL